MVTTVFAKERAWAPVNAAFYASNSLIYCDVPIAPLRPLHLGQKVHIRALTPYRGDDHPASHCDARGPPPYVASPPFLRGVVVGMRFSSWAVTEFVVRSEDERTAATHACLQVQHVQGVTAGLGLWHRFLRIMLLLLLGLPNTKEIPLEPGEVLLGMPPPPVVGEYPPRGSRQLADVWPTSHTDPDEWDEWDEGSEAVEENGRDMEVGNGEQVCHMLCRAFTSAMYHTNSESIERNQPLAQSLQI